MILNHKHLPQNFINSKTIHRVTQQTPLVVVTSTKFTFMNEFLLNCLKINNVKFELRQTQQSQVMCYTLPAIAFNNYFLASQSLIEFLCDLMLNKQTFADMTQRKYIVKDQYKKWFQVIREESNGLCGYSAFWGLGIRTQQDYLNHLFSQFLSMASWIKSDILERKYQGFKRTQVTIETLIINEVVKSILSLCQKTKADHLLRAHFQNLMQFHEEFNNKVQKLLNQQERIGYNEIQIVTDKIQEQSQTDYPNLKFNWQRFSIAFIIAAGIYAKWVE